MNSFHLTGDPCSATEAITALDCPAKFGFAKTPEEISMIAQQTDARVRLVRLGRVMLTQEVYTLPGIVGLSQLLAFGAKFKTVQLDIPIITAWLDEYGQLWYALLYRCAEKRLIEIKKSRPLHRWLDRCRVLVYEQSSFGALEL